MSAPHEKRRNQPLEFTQVGLKSLRVRWADGHESEFPLPQLRAICPCAACRTAEPSPAAAGPFRVLGPEPSSEPAGLEQVGNYALGVTWKDGHHSIYAFDLLRAACPCSACATDGTARDAGTSTS